MSHRHNRGASPAPSDDDRGGRDAELALVREPDGHLHVSSTASELRRLHYFDGKFLRADHLALEQAYLRGALHMSNRAGGAGVVRGLVARLVEGEVVIEPGLAIDGRGRLLHVPAGTDLRVGLEALIALTERERGASSGGPGGSDGEFDRCPAPTPTAATTEPFELFVITLGHAEALCGDETVYGGPCADACAPSRERPYWLEGVVCRARRVALAAPLPRSSVVDLRIDHLQSRLASAVFAQERALDASWLRGGVLRTGDWREPGIEPGLAAILGLGDEVPVAVIARAAGAVVFDAWIARRERIDPPARTAWGARLELRPWSVFAAQVLQFQAQLPRALVRAGAPRGVDDERVARYRAWLASLPADLRAAMPDLPGLERCLGARSEAAASTGRVLLDGGIVELPPAGYLPVTPGDGDSVNRQLRTLLGEGVDVRVCVARRDAIAQAFDEAQHLDRISLLAGLDDPAARPEVDVLVPDGEILEAGTLRGLRLHRAALRVAARDVSFAADGIGRVERLATGGVAFHVALASPDLSRGEPSEDGPGREVPRAAWVSLRIDHDPLRMRADDAVAIGGRLLAALPVGVIDLSLHGELVVTRVLDDVPGHRRVLARLAVTAVQDDRRDDRPDSADTHHRCTHHPLSVTLVIDGDPATGRLRATLVGPGVETSDEPIADLDLAWSGDPQRAHVTVDVVDPQLPDGTLALRPIVDLRGEDAGAIAAARQALDFIAVVACDLAFRRVAERLLLPEVELDDTGGLEVRATRDWVLFHRRRVHVCTPPRTPRPAPVVTRYRVLYVPWTPNLPADHLREILVGPRPEQLLAWSHRDLGIAEFDADRLVPRDPQPLIDAWASNVIGDAVLAAFIARVADAPLATERARLATVQRVLANVRPLATADAEALPHASPLVATAGADGVIVLYVGERPAQLTRQVVYKLVAQDGDHFKRLTDLLQLPHMLPSLLSDARRLGVLVFERDNVASSSGMDLVSREWRRDIDSTTGVAQLHTYAVPGHAASWPLHLARANAAALALDPAWANSGAPQRHDLATADGLPDEGPVFVVLLTMAQDPGPV